MIKVAAAFVTLCLWSSWDVWAAPMIGLICAPLPDKSNPAADPIQTISVTYQNGIWTVVHTAASGKFYIRSEQYDMKDVSGEASSWAWIGSHKRKKNLQMISATYASQGEYFYVETISDTVTGKQLGEINASCVERTTFLGLIDSSRHLPDSKPSVRPQRPVNLKDNTSTAPDAPVTDAGGLSSSAGFEMSGGTPQIPVLINDRLSLDFIIDSGASDVSIPSDVALTLVRTGTISQSDFLGKSEYSLADGSTTSSSIVNIRSLTVGGVIVKNVKASVTSPAGPLLLGQSFLTRLPRWGVNNETNLFEFAPPSPKDDVTQAGNVPAE